MSVITSPLHAVLQPVLEEQDGGRNPDPRRRRRPSYRPHRAAWPVWLRWQATLALMTLAVLLIHGYHPLAEDGGLYVAGVQLNLHPELFPQHAAFVQAHTTFSLFAPLVAALTRVSRLPLEWMLLLLYLLSIRLVLGASRSLLGRCTDSFAEQLAGVSLLAAWATLPVAGTSLLLTDPYLTARSLSLPLALYAIAFALDPWEPTAAAELSRTDLRKSRFSVANCLLCLAAAATLHPLMTAYAAALVVAIRIMRVRRPGPASAAYLSCFVALAAAGRALSPRASPAEVAASLSRYYWFLSQWHWYEIFGLLAPLALFALLLRCRTPPLSTAGAQLCKASLLLGVAAVLIAMLFAPQAGPTYFVARLQPLRAFLLLYALMALLIGSQLTAHLQRFAAPVWTWLPLAGIALSAASLFAVQRATFPASLHLELPGRTNPNAWSQSFVWARRHTPVAALFALDADYISDPGEDAQGFRATALRGVLPDFSKDGGEASITPSLARAWQEGVDAQRDLSRLSDSVREARLRPLGVTWMLLRSSATTHHPCPYNNGTVKACRLDP